MSDTLTLPSATPTELPSGWRTVRFGDVVRNVDVPERQPLERGIDRYVGLEHIDPESLHIKRWGNIADGTSFTRKFTEGQVLFGKRRAYQRKVAVAEFTGICSGDILVFEPKDAALIPELLPFIVQSEGFFQHALGTSAGSLSPRTRWRDLAEYEFALPPLDEQRRIADILWAADANLSRKINLLVTLDDAQSKMLTTFTTSGIKHTEFVHTEIGKVPEHWTIVTVGDVVDICQYGLSIPLGEKGQYPIFRMMNFDKGYIVENDMKFVDLDDENFETYKLNKGDILFNRTNSAELVGKVGIYNLDGNHVFASYLIRLRAKRDLIHPEYLNYYLNSRSGQDRILAYATPGVSQTNINGKNLRKVLVPLPPLKEQEVIITAMQHMDFSRNDVVSSIAKAKSLKQNLSLQLLRG